MLLSIPGVYGFSNENAVTYDLSSQLNHSAASRRGLRLMAKHFEIGEINPVTVLLVREDEVPREGVREDRSRSWRRNLYKVEGVATVRTADDPLGDFPPDRDMSLLSGDAWRRRALRNHRIAQRYFFSSRPTSQNRLARLDVTIDGDPFSIETARSSAISAASCNDQTHEEALDWKGCKRAVDRHDALDHRPAERHTEGQSANQDRGRARRVRRACVGDPQIRLVLLPDRHRADQLLRDTGIDAAVFSSEPMETISSDSIGNCRCSCS